MWEDWYGKEEGVGVGRRRCRCGRRWLESGEEVSMGGG